MSLKQNLFIVVSVLFLLSSIPLGVALIKQQTDLRARASTLAATHLEIIGDDNANYRTTTPNVQIRVVYVSNPPNSSYPTAFRLSNQLTELDRYPETPFNHNGQTVNWQLEPLPGTKTVYAQFKVAGSWTQPIAASIILAPN